MKTILILSVLSVSSLFASVENCEEYLQRVCIALYKPVVCSATQKETGTVLLKGVKGSNSCHANNQIRHSLCEKGFEEEEYTINCVATSPF
jgi:hypothetical protein